MQKMPSNGISVCFSRQRGWADPKKIIPLPVTHIKKTNSELQLEMNKEAAKLHEYQMYDRIMRSVLRKREQAEIKSPAETEEFPSPRCISGLPHHHVSYSTNRKGVSVASNTAHWEFAQPSGSRGFLPSPLDDDYSDVVNEEEGYGYFHPTSPPIIDYTSAPNPNKRLKNLSNASSYCKSFLSGANCRAAKGFHIMKQNTLPKNEDVHLAPPEETNSFHLVEEGVFALDL